MFDEITLLDSMENLYRNISFIYTTCIFHATYFDHIISLPPTHLNLTSLLLYPLNFMLCIPQITIRSRMIRMK